ncbi:uncharacterized protein NPIL_2811 [Nephila pilipes]|uniref:Uncharacterized protein n=1 Tax=Nephila pilipes TaxID=299642 RepID=A0A8X6TPM7_NEPPI|nr:uncharacterized protein NPIL_2811 [Nephila pilipes]
MDTSDSNMKFACDLVHFIMVYHGVNWNPLEFMRGRHSPGIRFTISHSKTIAYIFESKLCFWKPLEHLPPLILSPAGFLQFASFLKSRFETTVHNTYSLLVFSCMVSYLAALLKREGFFEDAPDFAVMLISQVISSFRLDRTISTSCFEGDASSRTIL